MCSTHPQAPEAEEEADQERGQGGDGAPDIAAYHQGPPEGGERRCWPPALHPRGPWLIAVCALDPHSQMAEGDTLYRPDALLSKEGLYATVGTPLDDSVLDSGDLI